MPCGDQISDAMRERPRLARTRTGNDQHRSFNRLDSLLLLRVEPAEDRLRVQHIGVRCWNVIEEVELAHGYRRTRVRHGGAIATEA